MGDLWPVGRAAEIGHRHCAERTGASGKKMPAGEFAENLAGIFNSHAKPPCRPTGCAIALIWVGSGCDGPITAEIAYRVPVARNTVPALCRLCGMFISSALRSATALWNCSSAMLKAVKDPCWIGA